MACLPDGLASRSDEVGRWDAEVALAVVCVLVKEGAARRLVERRERRERVHLREAVLAAEGISPDEWRHVRTASGHERLGREDTLVRPVRPVGPALLWVAEVARVTVLHAQLVEAVEFQPFVGDHLRVGVEAEQVGVRHADRRHWRRRLLHFVRHLAGC